MNPLAAIIPSLILGNPNGLPQVLIYKGLDEYGDLTVFKMPEDYVDRTCRRLGSSLDDTGRKSSGFRSCYDYNTKTMWIGNSLDIEHEYCHRMNPPKWDGKTWKYDNNCDTVHTEVWKDYQW